MATENQGATGDTGAAENQGETGDTGSNENGATGGDTTGSASSSGGDTTELEQLRAEKAALEKKVEDLTADRDKAARKREETRANLSSEVAGLKKRLDDELAHRRAGEAEKRESGTEQAVLGELHADHRNTKTAERVVKSLKGDGLDFAAEDRAPVVAKATEILKKDHPELFEAKPRNPFPDLSGAGNGGVESEGKGGIRNEKGERVF